MKTIKFTEAKTEELKSAIYLLDMFRHKAALKRIKAQAEIKGLILKGRSFSSVYPQLVEFYNQALLVEEAEALKVAF